MILPLVIDGTCMVGLLPSVVGKLTPLRLAPLLTIDLVPVVSPCHPLAGIAGPIAAHELHRHVQLVLTDASAITGERDHGVLSSRAWRLADMGAKKAMLLAGLGWGSMPDWSLGPAGQWMLDGLAELIGDGAAGSGTWHPCAARR